MGSTRGEERLIALIGIAMIVMGGFFGRTAPGLWASAIRYANAPRCATPDQRDCVRHLTAKVTNVIDPGSWREREHLVSYSGDESLAVIERGRPARVAAPNPALDRLSFGRGAEITVRVWEGRVTAIGRDGIGYAGTLSAPWHAAVRPTAWALTATLGGLALLALAFRRRSFAPAMGVAAAGAFAPLWLTRRLGEPTAPEALATALVAVTGTALLLSVSRRAARTSPPRPRAAPSAAR